MTPTKAGSDCRFVTEPGGCSVLLHELTLRFVQASGRWTHALAVASPPGLFADIANAVEADADRDGPARVVSPVYQELHDHPVPEGVCTLLTGQYTPHHFSAVVTTRREGPSVVIEVDVADRCRAAVEVLAATYLVPLGSSDLVDADSTRIVWGGDALNDGRLEFSTRGEQDVVLAEAGRRASRVQAVARLVPSTFTQRLYYAWRWTPAGETRA